MKLRNGLAVASIALGVILLMSIGFGCKEQGEPKTPSAESAKPVAMRPQTPLS